MPSKINTLLCALGTASALALPGTRSTSPITTQQNIVSLENEVTELALLYTQQNQPESREVFTELQTLMSTLGPRILSANYVCPIPAYYLPVTKLDQAVDRLNSTQGDLNTILHELPYERTQQQVITTNFCAANFSINSLHDYSYNDVGSDKTALTPCLAEEIVEISLEALIASLGITPNGQKASTYSQAALAHSKSAVGIFAEVSKVDINGCKDKFTPANSSTTAGQDATYLHDHAVPAALLEVEAGANAVDGFCAIEAYLTAIGGYVNA